MKYFIVISCFLLSMVINSSFSQTTQQLKEIDEFIQHQRQKNNIPGLAVCIVHNDSIILALGYGKTSTGEEVTVHTPFAIASLSKAFTAAAVLQLTEQNKIDLDAAAITYIKNLPAQLKNITVRELLHQTSGLSDKIFPELQFYQQPDGLDASIERMKNVELKDQPGKRFQYHNPNYQLLAKVVESASGKTFSNYLKQHILDPLGMNETHAFSSTKDFDKSGLKNGHNFLFGYPYSLAEPDWFVEGAAGMISSANDMAKWMKLILKQNEKDDSLLTEESFQLMLSVPTTTKSSYGMGWVVHNDSTIGHNGILWSYQSDLMLMRKQGYGVVILFNSGLHAYQDYSIFMTGISSILMNKPVEVSKSFFWINLMVIAFIMIVIVCGFVRFKRMVKWENNIGKISVFACAINILLRLIPITVLLLLPTLLTAVSGRVLSWNRIFYMMPEIIIWLALLSLLNITVISVRWNSYKSIFISGRK